jgi:hypothetical protein
LGGDPAPAETTAASDPAPSLSTSTSQGAPSAPTSDTAPPAPGPSASNAPEQSLASRDFTVTGTYSEARLKMRFDVTELKRRGDLLDLKAKLTNLERDQDRDLRWQVASRFQGSYRKDINTTDGVFSGAVLTDVAGKKRYFVAADSGQACVCTSQLSSTFVGAGQSIELTATYAAPPATATKLDVSVTSLGTFRDLPVT